MLSMNTLITSTGHQYFTKINLTFYITVVNNRTTVISRKICNSISFSCSNKRFLHNKLNFPIEKYSKHRRVSCSKFTVASNILLKESNQISFDHLMSSNSSRDNLEKNTSSTSSSSPGNISGRSNTTHPIHSSDSDPTSSSETPQKKSRTMLKLSIAFVLIASVAVSSGWSFRDDKEQRIREAEEIAAKNLEEFKAAVKSNDKNTIAQLVADELLAAVDEAFENNKKFFPTIDSVLKRITDMSNGNLNNWFRAGALSLLVRAIDGNRDNLSYYRLDAGKLWVDRRVESTSGQLKSDLTDARTKVVDARDTLDALAQVFVKGIKDIKQLTPNPFTTGRNTEAIRAVVTTMNKAFDGSDVKLFGKYQAAVDRIKGIIAFEKHENDV